MASRMEESNAWRNPIDLIEILETSFEQLPGAVAAGARARGDDAAVAGPGAVVPWRRGRGTHAAGHALGGALPRRARGLEDLNESVVVAGVARDLLHCPGQQVPRHARNDIDKASTACLAPAAPGRSPAPGTARPPRR